MRQGLGKLVRSENNLFQLTVITVCTFALMCWLLPGTFLTVRNFRSMSFQFPELGILSIAMMLAMLTGGIDLSLVGVSNLASILVALMFVKVMPPGSSYKVVIAFMAGAVALAVSIGALCGLLNGFLISKFNVPPILATLGSMQLYTGIAIVITKGAAVVGFPPQYSVIGNGSIGIFGIPLIIFISLLVIFAVLLRKTNYGVNVYLIGANIKAAVFAGIKTDKVLMISYMVGGCLAGLAGLVMSSRTNGAKADYGTSYILQSILVSVLGGVKPSGGSGNVIGILISVLALQFLSSGFSMLRFSNFAKEFVWGCFLLAIMTINYFTNERRKT
ncbi:MAG: ABC transporter permease [Synergistaceae bacterium]|nr:ABC transporter permease [Synergistaceae bacterium]